MSIILNTIDFRGDELSTTTNLGTWHEQVHDLMNDDTKQYSPTNEHTPTEQKEISYEMRFTRDKELIEKYKQLRRRLYGIDRRFIGFREFSDTAAENYEDPDDQMLIMHDDNHVYGGACLRISTPQHPIILDLENDVLAPPGKFYFALKEQLTELGLDKYAYCEFGRIVVDPRLRKGGAIRRLYQAALERCLEYRVRYMFGLADRIRARLYRQIYRSVGVEGHIVDSIGIPMRNEYEGVEMCLTSIDMKKFYVTQQDPDAACLMQPFNAFDFY